MALADIYAQAGVAPSGAGLVPASTPAVAQGNADIASDYAKMAAYYSQPASPNGTTITGAQSPTGSYLVGGISVPAIPNENAGGGGGGGAGVPGSSLSV